jgi:hypothetical protein
MDAQWRRVYFLQGYRRGKKYLREGRPLHNPYKQEFPHWWGFQQAIKEGKQ